MRYDDNKDAYLKRLRRIEGQVRGLQRLVEEDTYCIDVLTQVASVSGALRGVAVSLLDEHVRTCVRDASDAAQTEERIDEAMRAIERLVRT